VRQQAQQQPIVADLSSGTAFVGKIDDGKQYQLARTDKPEDATTQIRIGGQRTDVPSNFLVTVAEAALVLTDLYSPGHQLTGALAWREC
jgi:hypothetical protein